MMSVIWALLYPAAYLIFFFTASSFRKMKKMKNAKKANMPQWTTNPSRPRNPRKPRRDIFTFDWPPKLVPSGAYKPCYPCLREPRDNGFIKFKETAWWDLSLEEPWIEKSLVGGMLFMGWSSAVLWGLGAEHIGESVSPSREDLDLIYASRRQHQVSDGDSKLCSTRHDGTP